MDIIKSNLGSKLQLTTEDYKYLGKTCAISVGVCALWLGGCKLKQELQRQMGFHKYNHKQIGYEVGSGIGKAIIPGLFIGSVIGILSYMR